MKKRSVFTAGLLAIMIIMVAAFLFYAALRPKINAMEPPTPAPDAVVSLVGVNFGEKPGELLLDDIPIQKQNLQTWSSSLILFRMPRGIDSAVVRVRTNSGFLSNPLMIAQAKRVPLPASSSEAAIEPIPTILMVSPATGLQIGKTIEIHGANFGDPEPSSAIYFSKMPQFMDEDLENMSNFLKIGSSEAFIEQWNDKIIAVRVPSGSKNAFIFVRTKHGASNAYPISVSQSAGKLSVGNAHPYTFVNSITLRLSAVVPQGGLSLFLPLPLSTPRQSVSVEVEKGGERLRASNDRWQEFRFGFDDTGPAAFEIERKYNVGASEMKADIATNSISPIGAEPPTFLFPYLNEDSLVPSNDPRIATQAKLIRNKEKNVFRQVVLATQWSFTNFTLDSARSGLKDEPRRALEDGVGGYKALALIDCALLRALGIPAVPVSGYLVRSDHDLIPHYWAEYFLLGIGWIPFDPALATGNNPELFEAGFTDRLMYYRGIDDKHIELSRGYLVMPPIQPDAQKKHSIPESFAEYDEVSQGAIYMTNWTSPHLLEEDTIEPPKAR